MKKIIKNTSIAIIILLTLVVGYILLKKSPNVISQTVALQKVKQAPTLADYGSSGNIGGSFEVNTDNLQKIQSGDSSYWRVLVDQRQLYCAAKGAHLSGKGKTKEDIKDLVTTWNGKESAHGEVTTPDAGKGKIYSRPYYFLKEQKAATYTEAFIVTYPDPDWNSWSAIKQEAIWETPTLNKNKKAPKVTGNGITASQLALQAAYYEQFARKLDKNNGTMNPQNTTKEENVRVLGDYTKQEYLVGPFSMTYINGNYGIVFGGISDMYVVGEETDRIEIESFVVKDSEGNFKKEIKPRYFTPVDDKNLVDTGAQNYPASGQQFYIKIKAPKDIHIKNIHVDFKWMKAEAKLYYFESHKYVAVFSHSHTAHCDGHSDGKGGITYCSGCCYSDKVSTKFQEEIVAYQDQLEPDGKRHLESTSLDIKIPGEKNLTIKLAGNVWEDDKQTKETKLNGKKDETEKMLPGVEVVLYEASKNKEVARTVTDKNGHYEFDKVDSKYKYYIEFIYNGQMYQPTYYEDNLSGGYSNATEIKTQREQYNLDYEQIGSYPENYKVRRKLYYEVGTYNKAYTILKYSNASGNTYTSDINEKSESGIKEIYEYVIDQASETKSYEKAYKNALEKFGNTEETKRKLQFIEDNRISSFTGNDTQRKVYPIYDKYTIGYKSRTIMGVEYKALYPEHLQIDFGLTRREVADVALMKEIEKATIEIKGRQETYYYNQRAKEEQVTQEGDNTIWDIGVRLSDAAYYNTQYSREIYKSDYLYKVEDYSEQNSLNTNQIAQKYGETEQRELEVYVTYKIRVRNQSQSIRTKIEEIVDYYDKEYEYVNDRSYIEIGSGANKVKYENVKASEQSKYSANTRTSLESEGYNNLYITGLDEIYLSSGQTANIYLTFKVRKDPSRFIYLDEQDVGKQNIAEINGYSTKYKEGTEIPNVGLTDNNKVAGLFDRDSVPGNIESPVDVNKFEDDTDKAINLRVILEKDNRTIEGTAWEDNRTEYEKAQATATGNGKKEKGEEGIDGVRVQLVELMDNGSQYVWKEFLTGQGTYEPIINSNNIVQTVTDNTKGKYVFTSFVPGNYIVRFIYGDNDETVLTNTQTDVTNTLGAKGKNSRSYNGQDYKSTTYEPGISQEGQYYLKYLNKDIYGYKDYANQNETGTYLYNITALDGKDVSVAKDIASRRQETIKNSSNNITNEMAELLASYRNVPEGTTKETLRQQIEKFKQLTAMTAETGNINVEVEKDKIELGNQQGNNDIQYNVANVNLGLEERPKAQLAINKKVDNVKVVLADGSVLFDAKQTATNVLWKKNETYEPVYAKGILTQIRNSNAKKSGLVQLSMDEELMHGATIQITYKLTVTNVGETDYNDNQFYYTGIVLDKKKVATTTANQVIDYVANNLQFDNTKNSNWKVISKEEITNQKLVNARLQDKVNTFNTIITTTENSTISKTPLVPVIYSQTNGGNSSVEETLYLTQSITPENESSDLTYKNIVEIVKTSNTVGRINNYSIVGNQDPTSEPAEVDSDKAEVVKILPPFGEMKNIIIITSTILAAVGILVIGIIVIKKKFLKK